MVIPEEPGRGRTPIAIVGGGIAGLAIAAILHQRGQPFELYERAQAFDTVGVGIQLSPNGVGILQQLGLGDALRQAGARAESIDFRHWADGRMIARTPHGQVCENMFGAPYCMIHRGALQRLLLSLLPRTSIRVGTGCVRVTEHVDHAELLLTDGSTVRADLVVGADGVHSAVRQAVVDDEERDSGYVVYRGLVPAERAPFIDGPPNVLFWLGPRRHITYYPISSDRTIHFSAVGVRANEPPAAAGRDAHIDHLEAVFSDWHPHVRRLVGAAGSVTRWSLRDRDIADRYVTERIALVGDAAHPMLPYLSQGANQALEDAAVLTACLSRWSGGESPAGPLSAYDSSRIPRTRRIHEAARQRETSFHLDDGETQRTRDAVMSRTESLSGLSWLYDFRSRDLMPASVTSQAR
jgi:salicylate hydroxylase